MILKKQIKEMFTSYEILRCSDNDISESVNLMMKCSQIREKERERKTKKKEKLFFTNCKTIYGNGLKEELIC